MDKRLPKRCTWPSPDPIDSRQLNFATGSTTMQRPAPPSHLSMLRINPPMPHGSVHAVCTTRQSFYTAFSHCKSTVVALMIAVLPGGFLGAADPTSDAVSIYQEDIKPLLETYCYGCHAEGGDEGNFVLDEHPSDQQIVSDHQLWWAVLKNVRADVMPPDGEDRLTKDEKRLLSDWILENALGNEGGQIDPGRNPLRRLNRLEYRKTIRDLMGVDFDTTVEFPPDDSGDGFDNNADALMISPLLAEKYLDAAKAAIGHALRDPDGRRRIIVATPDENRSPEQAAREVLSKFLPRAFRRPPVESEFDEYLSIFGRVLDEDASYESAIEFALIAAMVSPKFLFLYEEPVESEEPALVTHYEMASRLSYFLWASMPDKELMRLAEGEKLHDESVLAEQVKRMLRSDVDRRGLRRGAKVRGFAESFVEQWLGTRALGREFKPDASVASRYDSELEGGMKYEPVFFLEDLLAENRSLLNLIDSDFTYVNRRLARHYRVKGEFREQPKFVELKDGDHRGGLLGMSAVLAVSSLPHRTSPVLRGKWILETMLGTPLPPPPPNVPALEESTDAVTPASLRERLELHRTNSTCASCHDAMDPLGFGLENFDVLGRWRNEVDGVAIDSSGKLPSGEEFDGPDELKKLLMDHKDQFVRNLTRKMLGYALARGLTHEDDCVVELITKKLIEDDYKTQTLIIEIVKSIPFRYKQTQ